jgi:toxin-antitoxin system PIN domain toxin
MKRHLLDVNVLFAMLWRSHVHYEAAHAWFESAGHRRWATSPLTQLGALRLLTNPRIVGGAMSAQRALELIVDATQYPRHEFWALDDGMTAGLRNFAERLQGYSQWTDAALVWQAVQRGGVLVTFDSGVRELAGREHRDSVLVLKR